jgi:hypothetical protein
MSTEDLTNAEIDHLYGAAVSHDVMLSKADRELMKRALIELVARRASEGFVLRVPGTVSPNPAELARVWNDAARCSPAMSVPPDKWEAKGLAAVYELGRVAGERRSAHDRVLLAQALVSTTDCERTDGPYGKAKRIAWDIVCERDGVPRHDRIAEVEQRPKAIGATSYRRLPYEELHAAVLEADRSGRSVTVTGHCARLLVAAAQERDELEKAAVAMYRVARYAVKEDGR